MELTLIFKSKYLTIKNMAAIKVALTFTDKSRGTKYLKL